MIQQYHIFVKILKLKRHFFKAFIQEKIVLKVKNMPMKNNLPKFFMLQ